jgi:hypothetical protein
VRLHEQDMFALDPAICLGQPILQDALETRLGIPLMSGAPIVALMAAVGAAGAVLEQQPS